MAGDISPAPHYGFERRKYKSIGLDTLCACEASSVQNHNTTHRISPMSDFLTRVLPPVKEAAPLELQGGYYLVGIRDKIPHTVPFVRIADVPELCRTRLAGMNTYIAPASFKDIAFGRKAVNAKEMKAVYLDLDVAKPQNSYPTIQDAFASLGQFVRATGLAPTIIVHSGVGLQVYWTFEQPLEAAKWKQLMAFFAAAARAQGLIIDPSCVADAARVMRLPGTLHLTSGNMAQVLADNGQDWPLRAFWEKLKPFIPSDAEVIPQTPSMPVTGVMQKLAEQTQIKMPLTAKAEPVARGCPAVLTAGLASEPQWFHMIGVMRSCVDGREWAHKLSAMDEKRYKPEDTDAKFNRAKENSPPRCSTFAQVCPDMCARCEHQGKLTSPIQLGMNHPVAVEVEPAPQQESVTNGHLQLPDKFEYPLQALQSRHFLVDERGCVQRKWEKSEDGAWSYTDTVLTPAKLYYSHAVHDTEDGAPHRTHWFVVETVKGRELVPFAIDRDMSMQRIARWFMEANAFFTNANVTATVLMAFMNTYLQSVLAGSTEIRTLKKFGWLKYPDPVLKCDVDGFAVGAGVVTETGLHHVNYAGVAQKIADDELDHKGNLEEWKHIPRMYKTLDQKVAQLAMCAAFAAPLMRFGTGIATSSIFSLWSTESGKGKSQVMRACASVWGHPDKQFIQRHSSAVLRQRKLSTLVNLPCYMDEMTDVKDEDMYALAYTLVDGREKQKLKSSGAEMVETGDWKTTTFVTANKSFKEAAARHAGSSDASILRVMEYECNFQSYEHVPEVHRYIQHCIGLCIEHYGLAGPDFLYHVMQHSDRLATLTRQVENWAMKYGFSNPERYMSSSLALYLIAGRWACEWGYLDYDMDELEKWVITEFVPHNRKHTGENVVRHDQLLRDYLVDRQLNTIVVACHERPADMAPSIAGKAGLGTDRYVISYPQREAYVRIELDEGDIYITAADLSDWCLRRGYSSKVLLRQLTAQNMVWNHARQNIMGGLDWAVLPATDTIRVKVEDVEEYRALAATET